MSACEECWQRASEDVMHLGGSVVENYKRRLIEHEAFLLLAAARQPPASPTGEKP